MLREYSPPFYRLRRQSELDGYEKALFRGTGLILKVAPLAGLGAATYADIKRVQSAVLPTAATV
ncbi:hypothetical protein GCM10023333_02710 [Ferrimonas pelagia]|uniref:Uncharacterized protein n=1 Tax=Ferrimonas pelagia TaxID=1177826 RepID=A0ABP9ECV1_9GAMM